MEEAQQQFKYPAGTSPSEQYRIEPRQVILRYACLMLGANGVQDDFVTKSEFMRERKQFIRLVLLISSGKTHCLKDDGTLLAAHAKNILAQVLSFCSSHTLVK